MNLTEITGSIRSLKRSQHSSSPVSNPIEFSTKCAVVILFLFVIYCIIIKSTLDKLFDAISFGCTLVFDSGKRIHMV